MPVCIWSVSCEVAPYPFDRLIPATNVEPPAQILSRHFLARMCEARGVGVTLFKLSVAD